VAEDVRHRLFVAFEVREPARAALAATVEPLRTAYPGLQWADPQRWHVTLAFIGSVDAQRAAHVDAVAALVAARYGPIELRLSGQAGSFGRGVLYAELEETADLMSAQADLGARLQVAGFPVDPRPFTPHVTLGRSPRGARIAPQLLGTYRGPSVRWTVDQILVLRSRLRVGGAVHEVRSAHELDRASQDAGVR
jgi:RNA 2',3'-cyclic 3'-phosphodiesterase